MHTSICDLPNELVKQILCYLPPTSLPNFQLVNRRFNQLVDQLIWQHFCRTQFKYWGSEHQISAKFASNVDAVDWKTLFIQRYRIDRFTTTNLDSILSSQIGRIEKIQQIVAQGYDAKDCLLRHCNAPEDTEDVLARRYYGDAVLSCLHRILAIKEWSKLQSRQTVPLDRALAAFDMFVLHDREGDFDEVSSQLDAIAQSVRSQTVLFDDKTTRQKSLLLAQYLREHDLTGFGIGRNYHDLQNTFLGIALYSDSHPSLPLISTAILCCVARRLGIDAAACSFPFHVVAIIKPPAGLDLDGRESKMTAPPLYLDPFSSASELPQADLVSRLESIRAARSSFNEYLSASSVEEIVLRTGRNILNSVQESHRHTMARQAIGSTGEWATMSPFPDLESSFYGALWALLLLGIPPDGDGPVLSMRRRNYLPHIIEHFETHFPTDVGLIEEYILPLFRNTGEYAQLRESVRVTRSVDSMPKDTKRRTREIGRRVRHKIGQVFTHKRYHYQAVITGWDVECGADEHWMLQMRVHELARGKQQSFYHVLVEDKSVRYVAEENIEPVNPEIPHSLMGLAGRHFKRWDKISRRFVSNIRDEYPDD